uniref:Kinesin motor domain-containing protein n=1 Tax=Sus scrofa TaxID=9823 RepID=A0A8D1MB43_PIG
MGGRGAPLCAAQPVVAEGGPAREPLQLLEVSPRKRLTAGPEQDPCGSRPAPEGAGAGAEQGHSAGGGGWCRHCHTKLAELKRQAWKLVSGPGTPLRDPCLSALLLDKLPACRPEAERRCDVCATRLNQLSPEALRLLQAPASREDPDAPRGGPGLTPPSTGTGAATSQRDVPAPAGRQPSRAGPDRRKGLAWPSGPSVQVSVAPAGLGGALSTVTIQAQQCLEGMWSVSRVNSFLPPSCLAEAAVAAVAVADTVRDGPPSVGPDGMLKTWAPGGACSAALVTPAPGTPVGGSTGPSAAASFFLRAAQKLSLASKRKKPHPPPAPTARGASTYPTDFSGVLQLWPPPAPPCLLRAASKAKDNPSSVGKVKVMLRIWPEQGAQRSAESTSFLKVDPRKKQVTLYDPAAGPPGSAGSRRATPAAVSKMFAFDAVFPQDSEQAEVCSGTVADVLQSVVSGADGCIFSFGHTSLGKSFTMIGRDSSPQSLGVVPCAISWLFRLLDERKERTGTRFSVRVSAVEVCGRDQSLRDLLAEVASSSLQDAQSPGVYLREDPVCGAQLQNQSELRAPTAERAAFYLDAALAARSSGRAGCSEDARCSSHVLFTLHVYQYRMEKCSRGGMSGGRSRLHLFDLGSCEGAPGRGGEAPGGPLCLSLSALGSIVLALVSGAKHVPHREHRLTTLLRESLAAASCRATMIAHVSDAPARHAETLSTVQLAARIHRLRRKKVKVGSDSRAPPKAPRAVSLGLYAGGAPEEPGGADGVVRTPPLGTSGQAGCPRQPARGHRLERGLLTTTVTLQQPVELNGEDELVFTLVEELSLGALGGPGRPASLASFGSDCSLQALASGSRPVSIISSINDEFDAYTSKPPGGAPDGAAWTGSSHSSSISSWLSEVSVCTADGLGPTPQPPSRASPDPFSPDAPAGPDPLGPLIPDGSLEDSSLQFSEQDRVDSPGPAWSPRPGEEGAVAATRPGWEPRAASPGRAAPAQTLHSSLPRKPRSSSTASRVGCTRLAPAPPGPGGPFEDPWLLRADECGPIHLASASRAPSPALMPARRVVDGCEVGRVAQRPEAMAQIPPLRRGATTLGVTTPSASFRDAPTEAAACLGSPKPAPGSRKSVAAKGGLCPRPGGAAPPAPPERKSSLEHRSSPAPALPQAGSLVWAGAAAFLRAEGEARPGSRADHSIPRATSSLKARAGKAEAASRPTTHGSLERCEGLAQGGSKAREAPGRPARTVPRLGVPPASPTPGPAPACRSSPAKGVGAPKPPTSGGKGRSLAAAGSRALGAAVKPLSPAAGRTPGGPGMGPRVVPRVAPGVGAKASRGTIMGAKQALRAAHSRVNELAAGGAHSRSGLSWGSADSDSGNDSGVNVSEERPPVGPALPSPYSKVTAPRRPQRYSSGHGSDNSSVLSGELPPAMGRTALFYHSGGSSGYESMMRDSEATGSASSAPDSLSDSGAASPGARSRSLKSPKRRATGLQRRRLIPAPLPDAAALSRKPSLPGQWVDLPPPLSGSLKEPFEIKVYEIDDVERLQRHRPAPREDPAEGLVCVGAKLRLAERRQQRLREVQAKRQVLCEELAETQGRLMLEPGRWLEQFEVDPELEPESAAYLAALERATAALEQRVNLCKARVMMVTCFDISAAAPAAAPGPQEVDV